MKNWFLGPALTIFLSLPVQADNIRLATTTSTYNSGLLDHLLSHFRQVSETEIQVLAVGTGKALRLGENGDVDLVMTHAPAAEAEFVAAGFGIQPLAVMHNDFIIVGPQHDPANLYGLQDVGQGLQAVADAQQRFLSRGDDSGTHKKELQLWRGLPAELGFLGYMESGRGMGHTLQMASELQAYTLTDRGTWLALGNKLDLKIVIEADPLLINPYQVILVNPQRHPHVKADLSRHFQQWLVSPMGQAVIADFRINGEVLFVPSAGN